MPVQVDEDRPDAMIEAIVEHRIDVVVSWSLCAETFCIAVHEALAAGAFVVARADAGNIGRAIMTNAPEQGRCVDDERALFSLFEGSTLKGILAASNRLPGVLIREGGSASSLRSMLTTRARPRLEPLPFESPFALAEA